jgi:hypothetical protein
MLPYPRSKEIPEMRETPTMARKKTTRPKKAPITTTTKSLALRVNDEYAAWIEDLRAFNRTTLAGLFDQALADFAEKKGFRKPPERT